MDRAFPNLGLKGDWDLGEDNWKDDMDSNLLKLSVLCQASVINIYAAEPGAPAAGDVILLNETHATHPNAVAAYDEGAWHYFAPSVGWRVWNVAAGGFMTFAAGIWAVDVVAMTTEQMQDMIATFLTNGANVTLTYNDAGNVIAIAAAQPALYYNYGSFAATNITSAEVLMDHIVSQAHTLAANFGGCYASVGVNPTAAWTASILKNGVAVGQLAVSTAGVCTFTTTGGATVAMAAGDVLTMQAPVGTDATLGRLRFTFKGTI
jgi:YD repeat-containing protein